MTEAREVFARYLRQRWELGERELVLPRDALDALSSATAAPPAPRTRPSPRTPPGSSAGDSQPTAPSVAGEPPKRVPMGSLDALRQEAMTCTACRLAGTRTTVVFGEGNPTARLVVVGEAPGEEEDRAGRPFVGRAGKLLDQLLVSVGFPRESVYICNVLKCRPPKNRNPQPDEVHSCSRFLRGQLAAVGPRAILAVGTFPAQTLLNTTQSISRLRGAVYTYEGLPLVPTYHPAALLRNPSWIRPVWEDLQRLRSVLDA